MGISKEWIEFRHGMSIEGKQLRVAGRPGQHNQITNLEDYKSCNIPAGLVGQCNKEAPEFARITFRKDEGDNPHLWNQITNLSQASKDAGTLVGRMHPSRLLGMEVLFIMFKQVGPRSGTASGIRG